MNQPEDFKIVRSTTQRGSTLVRQDLVTTAGTWDDAVQLAQLFAEEHAERLDVQWMEAGNGSRVTGGCLTTNNGSRVFYTAAASWAALQA